MSNDARELGSIFRGFLEGLLGQPAAGGAAPAAGGRPGGDWEGGASDRTADASGGWSTSSGEFPPDYAVWMDVNNAPKLIPGHLLVVHLATSTCYQVDPETGDATMIFAVHWGPRTFLWRTIAAPNGKIYCSLSGTVAGSDRQTPPGYQPQQALFNYWGAVLEIDHRRGQMRVIVETKVPGVGPVRDPHGMQLLPDGRLLVCDFQGFAKGGAIYIVDPVSGAIEMVSESDNFLVPVSALLDADGRLWVANADMTAENDGEIMRFEPDGSEFILVPRSGKNNGQLVGVLQSNKDEELVVFRCEWPNVRGNSAVFLVGKNTGEIEEIFGSSSDDPRFYNTNGDVSGDMLWFGESVRKEIVGYNLRTREIEKVIDFRPVAGGWRGMIDSYDGIESVTVIPEITVSQEME